MSGRLARLDACSPKEKDDALAFLSGYSPDAFDRCMLHVERFRKPPRIPEPGLWGVVEANVEFEGDTISLTFVRHRGTPVSKNWFGGSYGWFDWEDLIDPVLVREGVES